MVFEKDKRIHSYGLQIYAAFHLSDSNVLYASLFDKSENYIKVISALSSKNKGLTRDELIKATKMESGGDFTTILQDLVDCDFIRCYHGYGNKSKMGIYQLIDPFSLSSTISSCGSMEARTSLSGNIR